MAIRLDERGRMPAIAQEADTGRVLMLAYVTPESLRRTMESGEAWFFSRSRGRLWRKGDTSGNVLRVQQVLLDCDRDAVLLKVHPLGPACHTGRESCFFTPLSEADLANERAQESAAILDELFAVVQDRKRSMPEGSYTAELLARGRGRAAQKVIEEAGEVALAAAEGRSPELPGEAADLLYHLLVLLAAEQVPLREVWEALRSRRR